MTCSNPKCDCANCINKECGCDGTKECSCLPESPSCCCDN